MAAEQRTKDPVTLDHLKRAIAAVGTRPFTDGDFFTTSRLCSWENRRADAWRTAFEWLNTTTCDDLYGDLQEGMALIREKLQS